MTEQQWGSGEPLSDTVTAEDKMLEGGGVVVVQSLGRPTLCDPMDCSTPGFPVLHHLLELAQTCPLSR